MKHLHGFSLFEVLITIFILAFGLLGIVGIYLNSFKIMQDSYHDTLGILKLHEQQE